jgi:hypothetical protein
MLRKRRAELFKKYNYFNNTKKDFSRERPSFAI